MINKNTSNNEKIKTFIYMLLLLPFLGISGIRNALGTTIYQGWQVASMILLMLFFIAAYSSRVSLSDLPLSFIVYEFLALFITIIYRGFSFGIIVTTFTVIFLSLLVKYDANIIIKAISVLASIVIVINLIGMIYHPVSQNENYFIGGKNQLSLFIIPSVFFILLNALNTKGKIGFWKICFLTVSVITIILGESGTGIVIAIITVISLVLFKYFKNKKVLICGIIALNILFLFAFKFLSRTTLWLKLTLFLDKSATLTGRTTIWNLAWEKIREHWLFGNGKGTEIAYINTWNQTNIVTEAHNVFLEVTLVAGLVGLAIYVIYFIQALKNISLENNKQRLVFIAIFVCLINGLTESINNNMLFILLLAIAYYSSAGTKPVNLDSNKVIRRIKY